MNWKKLVVVVHKGIKDFSTNSLMHFLLVLVTGSYISVNSGLEILFMVPQKLV